MTQRLSARGGRAGKILAVLSLALFAACQVNRALYFPPYSDDAWMVVVARNLAFGHGWASSMTGLFPLDPSITTGPGLLGVVAIGIALFGNLLWLPHLLACLLNLSLLLVLLWRLHAHLEAQAWYGLLFLLPLLFANTSPHMWIVCQGDLTAFLYLALAAVLCFEAAEGRRLLLAGLAGVLAAAAVLTKLVALVSVLGMATAYGLLLVLHRDWRPAAVRTVAACLAGMAVPVLAWLAYRHSIRAAMDPEFAVVHAAYLKHLYLHTGSGVDALLAAWQQGRLLPHLLDTVRSNSVFYTRQLAQSFLLIPAFFPLLLLALLLAGWHAWQRRAQPVGRLLALLLLAALAYLVWALALGRINFGRYVYIGLFLAFIPLVIWLGQYRRGLLAVSALVLLETVAVPPMDPFFGGPVYRLRALPGAEAAALQGMMDRLHTDHAGRAVASCTGVYVHEVDYLMPDAGRVTDCEYLLGQVLAFDHEAYAGRHYPPGAQPSRLEALKHFVDDKRRDGASPTVAPVQWRGPMDFVVVINPMGHYLKNFGREPYEFAPLRTHCATVYDDGLYALQDCREADLRRVIGERGGIWFYPPQWGEEVVLYEAGIHQPLSSTSPANTAIPTQ